MVPDEFEIFLEKFGKVKTYDFGKKLVKVNSLNYEISMILPGNDLTLTLKSLKSFTDDKKYFETELSHLNSTVSRSII